MQYSMLVAKHRPGQPGGGNWDHPVSRDHALPVIPCRVSACPANSGNGKCNMPSCISIDVNGKCELGRRALGHP